MLTFAEEFLLLSHDEKSGQFHDVPQLILDPALAAAALMDLALRDRIDTDLDTLVLVDRTPTGEKLLDHVLSIIVAEPEPQSSTEWLSRLRLEGSTLREMAIERMIERGILREQDGRFLWVFETRRYPLIEDQELQEVKLRIATLLFNDDIPDPRDIVIIALADTCGLLGKVFSNAELNRADARIQQIVKLDLIGQALRATIVELQLALAGAGLLYH
ncbi:MAG: GPP34 family phosphoprotein [Aliidongia sp.]